MTTTNDNGWEAPASRMLSVSSACRDCRSIDELKRFIKTQLREVLPHQLAMCGLCETRSGRILRLINIDFPLGYLRQIIRPDQIVLGGPLREWLCERSPTVVHIGRTPSRGCPADRDYGITSFSCHGIADLSGTVSSYFAFARLDHGIVPFERELLGFIVPHLHETMAKLLTSGYVAVGASPGEDCCGAHPPHLERQHCASPRLDITEREREVLQWIAAGKSNWEIGKILEISEFTVKNHVQSLLKALGVTSRAHAATKAMSSGLIARSDFPALARFSQRAAAGASSAPSPRKSRGRAPGAGYLRGEVQEPSAASPRLLR